MSKQFSHLPLPTNAARAFKDADIRGAYPDEINAAAAYRVARAFVAECALSEVIVGRDMRHSSPELREAFIAGARDSGADVRDLGLAETPLVYYASGKYSLPGVIITASHNPAGYNGLKLVTAGAVPVTRKTGLAAIQKRIKANTYPEPTRRGSLRTWSIMREYEAYVKQSVPLKLPRQYRVVVDVGNGMASTVLPLLERIPNLEITPLFTELDGSFPNRPSNPTLKKSQRAITAELKTGAYDFGIAFDGDADRVAFFDERGRYSNSAVIGALLAEHVLAREPGAAFVYTVFTSKVYEETIRSGGGTAVRARVGHAFIKEVMRRYDAYFACEHSAHFYFRDNYYADSGILAVRSVLAALAASDQDAPFSRVIAPYQRYHQTEEVLVKVTDKKAALRAVETYYQAKAPEKIERFDGVTVRFADHWLVVKESVTEDALKYVVEAPQVTVAKTAQRELREQLRQYER